MPSDALPLGYVIIGEVRARGKHIHMGRVNSQRRIEYAKSVGVDSIDGIKYVRWRDRYLNEGLAAVSSPPQHRLALTSDLRTAA